MSELWEEVFEGLEDPGAPNARRHEPHDIPVIAFCTMPCGGQTCTVMELSGPAKRELLQTFLRLENAIPSHDTLSRTLGMPDPLGFEQWSVGLMQGFAQGCQGVIALDGKTLRRPCDRTEGRSARHLVSAWAEEQRLVLCQLAVGTKSNEITAVPQLLELLALRGKLATADAALPEAHHPAGGGAGRRLRPGPEGQTGQSIR